jgi:beta-glucosidase
MLGPWAGAGNAAEMVSFLEGLSAAFPASEILHAPGVEIDSADGSGIPAAVGLARDADLVVLCLGESPQMSGEAASRARPGLPGCQSELAEALFDLGKPSILLLSSGRPLIIPGIIERADAVLATWFPGCEAGNAVGDVLSGQWSPSGRLPVTWPVDIGQIPIFYAQRPTGRPADPNDYYTSKYIDMPVEPLFRFAHGLSYTRFTLGKLRIDPVEVRPGQKITIEVEVVNEGAMDGEETVLLFVRDVVASVARPVVELKGMAKIALSMGDRRWIRLELAAEALAFPGPDMTARLEPGTFEISVGLRLELPMLKAAIRLLPLSGSG